jgi:diguanylate cyclase (GGDEF)-like protein/PAS domain S-box-containing protein
MGRLGKLVHRAAVIVPAGVELGPGEWEQRHRWIKGLLLFHVPVIVLFGVIRGKGLLHSLVEAAPVACLALFASDGTRGPRTRSIAAGLGLMVSSAVLVHLSGGSTEMHFHFFVMLGVISLYQDWRPFLVSIAFVAAHHGIMGTLRPTDVFNNPAAWHSPLKWAVVHAFFVLAACAVSVVSWRIVEDGHRRSRAQLEASEHRFRALIEHSTDVVTVVNADGLITYDSPSAVAVLGYAESERVGIDGLAFIHPDDIDRAVQTFAAVIDFPGSVSRMEMRSLHRDGTYRWLDVSVTNLLDEDDVNGLVANFRDITERKALEDQLAHQAFHDPLTGLANRALLLDRVEHARAATRRRSAGLIGLIYIDLDDFKTVNDGLGHEAGDNLLRLAALRIVSALRPGDTAARLGGDEFAVLLEELPNPSSAYEVGARLLEALGEPFEFEGHSVPLNASLGIVISNGTDDAAALLRNADLAMYRAKGEGKGRFEVYEAGMHAAVVERMAVKADLRRAVDAREFHPHYQPIVDLASGRINGVEALVRWSHPERGLLAPATFIPLAEETGLIVEIGRHVLNEACLDAASWRRHLGSMAPKTVSVNLSPRQIQDPALIDDVAAALASSGLPASCLTLEITESILVDDGDAAARTLGGLKALGITIALDDFGTGYSSLSYLDRFPVDIVKIDKSFIDALSGAGTAGSPLVTAIVNLGSLLGLSVTAEGIEDVDQVARLRQIGCARGQGFYFAHPMPADELRDRLTQPAPSLPERVHF